VRRNGRVAEVRDAVAYDGDVRRLNESLVTILQRAEEELMRPTGTGHEAPREHRPRQLLAMLRAVFGLCACAAGVVVLVTPPTAGATFGGRNGLLLMSSFERASPATHKPVARKADCSGRPDLWTVRPDGSHLARIGWGESGLFSPMGRRVAIDYGGDSCWAYGHNGRDPSAGLFVSRADGSKRRRIRGTALVGWLPNGQLIVVGRGGSLVHALTGRPFMTGTGAYVLDGYNYEEANFALSCSGRLAVARPHELDIYTRTAVRVHGTVRVRTIKLTVATSPHALDRTRPVWSPDGRSLLFAREQTGNLDAPVDLWTVGVNGQGLRRLTDASTPQLVTEDTFASWSPDGRRILFYRTQVPMPSGLGQSEYGMVMNADGSDQHIFDRSGYNAYTWSPDGRSIAINGYPLAIFDVTTGRTRKIPYEPWTLVDWQALPTNHPVRCAHRAMAPVNTGPNSRNG
jgi:hypothetical protein